MEKSKKSKKTRKGAKAKAKKAVRDVSPVLTNDMPEEAVNDAKAKAGPARGSGRGGAKKAKAAAKSQNAKPKVAAPSPEPEVEAAVPLHRRMDSSMGASSTFARRYQPHGKGLSQSKWIAIRAAFYKNIYPHLAAPSRHEDRHLPKTEASLYCAPHADTSNLPGRISSGSSVWRSGLSFL